MILNKHSRYICPPWCQRFPKEGENMNPRSIAKPQEKGKGEEIPKNPLNKDRRRKMKDA